MEAAARARKEDTVEKERALAHLLFTHRYPESFNPPAVGAEATAASVAARLDAASWESSTSSFGCYPTTHPLGDCTAAAAHCRRSNGNSYPPYPQYGAAPPSLPPNVRAYSTLPSGSTHVSIPLLQPPMQLPPPPPMQIAASRFDDPTDALVSGRTANDVRPTARRVLAYTTQEDMEVHSPLADSPPAHPGSVSSDSVSSERSGRSGRKASCEHNQRKESTEPATDGPHPDLVPVRCTCGATEGRPVGAASTHLRSACNVPYATDAARTSAAAATTTSLAAAASVSAGPLAAAYTATPVAPSIPTILKIGAACGGGEGGGGGGGGGGGRGSDAGGGSGGGGGVAGLAACAAAACSIDEAAFGAAVFGGAAVEMGDGHESPLLRVGAPIGMNDGGHAAHDSPAMEVALSIARTSGRVSSSDITPRCDILPTIAHEASGPRTSSVLHNSRSQGGAFSRTRLASAVGPTRLPLGSTASAYARSAMHLTPEVDGDLSRPIGGAAATVAAALKQMQSTSATDALTSRPPPEAAFEHQLSSVAAKAQAESSSASPSTLTNGCGGDGGGAPPAAQPRTAGFVPAAKQGGVQFASTLVDETPLGPHAASAPVVEVS